MKKSDMRGLVNDLFNYLEHQNPLRTVSSPNDLVLNLLTGEVLGASEEDSLVNFLKKKSSWFNKRLIDLGVDKKDLGECIIKVKNSTELISIEYKKEIFTPHKK